MNINKMPIPAAFRKDPEVESWIRSLTSQLVTEQFDPTLANWSNVDSAYARYQRVGQIIIVTYEILGTSVTNTTSSTLKLPVESSNRISDAASMLPMNIFLIGDVGGSAKTWMHQTDKETITADSGNVSTTGAVCVQGFYWANN